MPISSVLVALLLALVVGVFSASPFGEREVAHAQTAPTLSNIELTLASDVNTDLSPVFDGDVKSYTMRVSNPADQIQVEATLDGDTTGADATITINGQIAISGIASTVDLRLGVNNITIIVEDVGLRNTYTVRVTRVSATASNDTKLRTLSLSNVMLSSAFDPDKRTGYSDKVRHSTGLTTVEARAANSGAMAAIKYTTTEPAASGDTPTQAELGTAFDLGTSMSVDSNNVAVLAEDATPTPADETTYILIRVRAADVSSLGYYAVEITRAASDASGDARLASATGSLALEDADNTDDTTNDILIIPTYGRDKITYTASVPYTVKKAEVTANADTGAVVMVTSDMDDKIDDTDEDSHEFMGEVGLEVGANVITIEVEAANAIATKTYTVTVTRATTTASADANLSSLVLTGVTLSPTFDPGETAYTATVPHNTDLTNVTASAADSDAMVSIPLADSANVVELAAGNTAQDAGTTTIAIRVMAENGVTMKRYIVMVTRVAANANSSPNLSELSLTDPDNMNTVVSISPTFDAAKTAYTASAPYTVRKVTVNATPIVADATTAANDVGAGTAKVTSDTDDDIDDDNVVDLEVGANVITIKVDAANAIAKKTYKVTVTRAAATASADANLSSLVLTGVTLVPAFDPGEPAYSAIVPNANDLTRVIYTTMGDGATAQITLPALDNEATKAAGNNIDLGVGTNIIDIDVTAANGVVIEEIQGDDNARRI